MSSVRAIRLVAAREIVLKLRSRVFKVSTTITVLLVVGLVLAPRLLPDPERSAYTVALPAGLDDGVATALHGSAEILDVDLEVVDFPSGEAAETAVAEERAEAAVTGERSVTYLDDRDTRLQTLVNNALHQHGQQRRLLEAGLDAEEIALLTGPVPEIEEVVLEPSAGPAGALGVTFLSVFGMFAAIGLYSQWVMSGVLEEKSSRVVEVVLGAITPRQLIAGKIIGVGGLGLLHLAILAAAGAGTALATGARFPPAGPAIVITAVIWFLLGYAFYAMLSGVAASLISRQEDLQVAFLPVMAVAMVSYFVSFAAAESPGTTFGAVASAVPSVAPFVMPARAAFGVIDPLQQVVSAAIMLVAIWVLAWVGSRLYSGAVLRFGPRIGLREAWRRT